MEATDLRIGNLIDFEATTHIVESIDRDGLMTSYWIKDIEELYKHAISQIKPILLTEEWLLKFGFRKESNSLYVIGVNDFSYILEYSKSFDDGRYFLGIRYDDWDYDSTGIYRFSHKIEYVNQLQNLYHALTHKELTLQL